MERETFPLTAAQRMIHAMTLEHQELQVTCLGACLMMQADLDLALLEKCIRLEEERYDCLRLRFTAADGSGEIQQYLGPRDSGKLKIVDLAGGTMAEAERQMKLWTQIPFVRTDARMCEFILLNLPDGYQGVYLRIDHLLADSCAVITLANDMMELYCHFAFGTPAPKACVSFREAIQKDLARAQNPVRRHKDETFWKEFIQTTEPIYTDIKGPQRLLESRRRHGNPGLRAADRQLKDCREGQESFYLEAEPTGRLLDFCTENRVSMTNLLLMGLRTYLSKQNDGERDISMRNYVSRRFSRSARQSGGSRVHCYPCRTILEPEVGFLEGIKVIQTLQNDIYRHVDYDSEKVFYDMRNYHHAPENTIYESVALTYQPMPVRLQNKRLQEIPYRALWFSNGVAVQPIYLTVMHQADGGLEFYVKYQMADYENRDIEQMYENLINIMTAGTENSKRTAGEILSLL